MATAVPAPQLRDLPNEGRLDLAHAMRSLSLTCIGNNSHGLDPCPMNKIGGGLLRQTGLTFSNGYALLAVIHR